MHRPCCCLFSVKCPDATWRPGYRHRIWPSWRGQDKVTTDGCTLEQNDSDGTSCVRQFAIMRRDEPAEPMAAVGTEGVFAGGRAPDAGTAYTGRPLEKGMCLSYWLQNVRCDPLLDHRTFDQQAIDALPSEADVVIIGSGITGTLVALTLLQSPSPPDSVLLLEAREFSSGATGRNAGHCKPDRWRGFSKYEAKYGAEQSLKILRNERETWEALVEYIYDNNVDCDLWVGKTLDVLMTDDMAEAAAKTMNDFKAAGGDASCVEVITDPREARLISRLKGAKAVYSYDASTLYPWKLVAHIAREALDLGLNLQTWTPVLAVEPSPDHNRDGRWVVQTGRGAVLARQVVHATNAYVGALLPETKTAVRPCPHLCDKVIPPMSYSGSHALQNSYAVVYPDGVYTINPRCTADGVLLFGGSAPNQQYLLDYVEEDERRRTDDSLTNFSKVTEAVQTLVRDGFGWPAEGQDPGNDAKFDYQWSGIYGRSADMVPLVGAVPGKPGQWMCAGHNGHGMARIFTCAPALARLMQGASWHETGLPECFEITPERLKP